MSPGLRPRKRQRDKGASIHRAAEKGSSRKPLFSKAKPYPIGSERGVVAGPNRRGEQHNLYHD